MFERFSPHGDADASRLLASMPVGFVLWSPDWRCVAVNAAGEQLCGKRASELYGRSLWDLFPDVSGTQFETVCRRVARTGIGENVEVFYPDPLNRWFDVHVVADDLGVAAYYVDVTSRHQAQDRRDLAAQHDRGIAHALQQVLLPSLPVIEGVNIVSRYLTAADTDRVGGDWYDAMAGVDGTLRVLIGDVAGHDINAAATMGQLRSMLRMSAWTLNDAPSKIVERLDQAAHDHGIRTTASLALVKIEAASAPGDGDVPRRMELTNAGHPPPILLRSDGSTSVLRGDRADLLLGVVPHTPRHDHVFDYPTGSTLVLYTDGLIETRGHDIDDRIQDLTRAFTRHHDLGDIDVVLDAVLDDMVGSHPSDDVAVITVGIS